MSQSKSECIGPVFVTQTVVGAPSEIQEEYDLCIAVVSWETRCKEALRIVEGKSTEYVVLRFTGHDPIHDAAKDRNYREFQSVLGASHTEFRLYSSKEFLDNCRKLEDLFRDRYHDKLRPLKVLVDMSCLPKRYVLYLVGLGFKTGLMRRMDYLYSEGRYGSTSGEDTQAADPTQLVSLGEWTSVQVPYFEGTDYAAEGKELIISLGAEISRALPIVERLSPKNLELITVDGTESRVPAHHLEGEKHALVALKELTLCNSRSFELSDVLGVAKHVLQTTSAPRVCFAIGSKPHALAMALCGLADDNVEIVCRTPAAYSTNDVMPTGVVFCFSVEDRFEPELDFLRS